MGDNRSTGAFPFSAYLRGESGEDPGANSISYTRRANMRRAEGDSMLDLIVSAILEELRADILTPHFGRLINGQIYGVN